MEVPQGPITLRYYGRDTTEISPDCDFKPWSRDPIRQEPRSQKKDDKSDAIQERKVISSWTLNINILILEPVGECLSYERKRTKQLR